MYPVDTLNLAAQTRSRTFMLWIALALSSLAVLSGDFAFGSAVRWYQAWPNTSPRGLAGAIVLVLGFLTNVIFWVSFIARRSQPVPVSWKVLMIASLINNVMVVVLIPGFAASGSYWLWLIAFVIATWAFVFLPSQTSVAPETVPAFLWVFIACTVFWCGVMVVNFFAPSRPRVVDADAGQGIALTSYVTDDAHLLQPGEQQGLVTMLRDFESRTTDQIGVAIYAKCPSQSIEDFTIRAAQASRFGRSGTNNGAILFVFLAERTARMEVGYGLEGALPDAIARRILDAQLAPHFARREYREGIAGTLSAMCDAVQAEYGTSHKQNLLAMLWPQFKVAMAKTVRRAWPLARDAPLEARVSVSFFGTLLGLGVWSGLENAARIAWDILLGIANLVRGRRFRQGMEKFELGSIYDTVKLMVIIACIAGGYVIVAGGGAFGGAGAMIRWV